MGQSVLHSVGSASFLTHTCHPVRTGSVSRTLMGHTGPVTCVACDIDTFQIVSGSLDKTIRVSFNVLGLYYVTDALIIRYGTFELADFSKLSGTTMASLLYSSILGR